MQSSRVPICGVSGPRTRQVLYWSRSPLVAGMLAKIPQQSCTAGHESWMFLPGRQHMHDCKLG